MPIDNATLKTILVDGDIVPAAEFEEARKESEKRGAPLDALLVDKNLIPDTYLGQLLAENLGYPYARLDGQNIPDHVLRIVPERVAKKSRVIAFGNDDAGRLRVAMHDPSDLELVRFVEKKAGVRVVPYFATDRSIRAAIERYAKDLESAIKTLLDSAGYVAGRKEDEEAESTPESDEAVIGVVELILNYAYQHGASDVHIEPREKEIVVRYRIDGILHDVVSLPRGLMEPIISRIKVLAKLRTDEHFAAQDGKLQEIMDGERVDVRVSVLPVVDGEKVVMRLLTEKGRKFSLDDIGMLERDLKKVRRHMQKSFGMILATGPTGSGKTTTMYSVLKILNTRDVNIATIEDPIEYAIEGVNQIQANPKTGLTFAAGLRSIVRQDPDIIMVGEIRDEETAGIAVNAAMTGHLVLSTLHTNDAATTLPRFRDMRVEPFLIASTINVIIAQRLARKLCQRCIVSYDASTEEMSKSLPEDVVKKFLVKTGPTKASAKPAGSKSSKGKAAAAEPRTMPATTRLFKGKGCDVCNHTGYKGRIGVYEVLEVDDSIRDLIMKNADAGAISRQAIANGMTTMFEDGVEKVLMGLTTLDEVLRVTGG